MIWVAGEALVDLLPSGPLPGGGPANTAIALSRLQENVQYIGGLSNDEYGVILRNNFQDNKVDLALSFTSDLPTALARVSLAADGQASYEFVLDQTATFTFGISELPGKASGVTALHIGSLATVIDPAASALFEWAQQLGVPILYDPNIRTAVIEDKKRYADAVLQWAGIATVIKLSDEDLAVLFPGFDEDQAVDRLLTSQCKLVVLTKGSEGLVGKSSAQRVVVPSVKVDVVDTVGAGDTVGAVLASALSSGIDLVGQGLEPTLRLAARAAAITCSRAGCNPPFRSELD